MSKNIIFDSSLEALTPEGVKFVFSPVGLPVRTLAYAIDKTTQWFILIIIFILANFLKFSTGIWLFLILSFLVEWFYYVFCELSFHGQSLGKRMTGIRVIRSDGSPVDPAASFLRNLLRFADTFFYLFHIAFISMTASRGFKRLGDWAGGTLVVYSQSVTRFQQNISGLLANYEPVSPPYPLSYDEKQAILSFARRYPLLGESRANEIAGIYAPYLKDNISSSISDSAFLLGIARNLLGEQQILKGASLPKDVSPKDVSPKETK
jgi:uncharacterized RDD family membrane protein YckC